MAIKEVIQYKIDRLINIMLTDGVQPGDIADNIYLDDYQKVTYSKCGDNIIGEVVIKETLPEAECFYILRYIYSKAKRIERIEEEKNGKIKTYWDRSLISSELINDIVELLKFHYNEAQMIKFLKSLPIEIAEKITCRVHEVA